jgi:hypothetical protein
LCIDPSRVAPLALPHALAAIRFAIDWRKTRPHGLARLQADRDARFGDHASPGGQMKPLLRISLVVVAALVAAVGGGALWLQLADHNPRYANVVSIAESPTYQDEALLARAWALPVAAAYREGGYEYQGNPSFCGPTSAANVAQSLGSNLTQRTVLRGTSIKPFLGFVPGVTLDQEAEILRVATGRPVEVLRDLDLAAFRGHLVQANDPSLRYVVNFNRAALWGQGHGHISPILGYLVQEDLVFVGDVNDDFRPFLVPSARLLEAMNTADTSTGKSRGLLRVGRAE